MNTSIWCMVNKTNGSKKFCK